MKNNITKKFNIRRAVVSSLIGALCLGFAACSPSPTIEMRTENPIQKVQSNSRYSVERVAVFEDNLAYNSRRGIYEITDHKTGQKYIGVSGIGISQRGSHSNGKQTFADER